MLPGAKKDGQLVTDEWQVVKGGLEGVVTREVLHVPRDHGIITETYRPEWDPTGLPIVHVYQSRLFPGAIGAWSCHAKHTDRLFVNQGHLKIVLFDGRDTSSTFGQIREHFVGDARPTFVVLPPGVWHGLQNLGASDALVLNYPTHAYDYEDPDHWRLPLDTDQIPYTWMTNSGARIRRE
ncbi:MAG TPA: dTDP-4-dehydrorhamnose 3,5-epimerase [Thermoanaerobaculia bacterium]